MISFKRPDSEGYRYSLGLRCRHGETGWYIQRWNGHEWVMVANYFHSYAALREFTNELEER